MRSIPRTLIQIIVILTILGSIFLVHTNSRSSILVKEASYVVGTALALLVVSLSILGHGSFAYNRFSWPLVVSFVLLILWMIYRHYGGVQSVNGAKYMYSTIALGGLVLIIAGTFTENARNNILWVMAVSAFILSVYAILQSFGIIIFPWDAGLTRMARSSGTMGNANLLGSFSMAMLPVGGGFLLSRRRFGKFRLILASIFVLLCTGAILASKTRSSLLGFLIIVLIIPFVPFIRRNKKRLALLILAFLILIGVSVFFLGNRMEELAHAETGSLQVRNLIWSGTLSVILSNPVLGYGPGSFQIMFPEFRNPNYFLLGVSHNTLHAHCEYLEILVDTGIIGLLLWAAVAYSVFRILYRNRKSLFRSTETPENPGSDWLNIGLITGIAALCAEASVSVALRWPPSALLLTLFTGLLLASVPSGITPLKSAKKYSLAAVLLLAAIILGTVSFPVYLRSMKSARELFTGKDMYLAHIQSEIENSVNSAQEWRTTGSDEAAQRVMYYFGSARQSADSAIEWCKKSIETNPDELGGWYALGSAYVSSARLHQQITPQLSFILQSNGIAAEDKEEAERLMRLGLASYDSLTRRAPNYAEVHNNLALVWISLGYPDSALASLRRAWDLHAHNREQYIEKVSFLNPITESFDGVYLRWQISMGTLRKLVEEEIQVDERNRLFRELLFNYGTAFLKYEDSADSLNIELNSIVSSRYPEIAVEINELTNMQIQRMQEGYNLIQRLEEGDTAGVMMDLGSIQQEELDILPIHRALKAFILASEGDIESMQTLCEVINFFSWNDIEDLTAWPIDIPSMVGELNIALCNSGLDESDERYIYLLNEINMLNIDRRIFEIMVFIESSPFLQDATEDVKYELGIIWESIGGPLYCFMNQRDEHDVIPVMRTSSLLEDSYSGLLALEAQDSLNAEMIKFEIQWLYVLFGTSYQSVPHYSTAQSEQVVSLLADARRRLVDVTGENEAEYLIGSMLNDLQDRGLPQIKGEFRNYLEALSSDLIMGRIIQTDLP